tara:strand:- start:5386 stop:7008 length:1623 start_codon:yes stop_codon:yes gene_type:complete
MNRKGTVFLVALLTASIAAGAQVDKKILNWYNSAKYGMSTDKAYSKLLSGKKSVPVVVAVIDSGVDIEHEDLKGSIWVNTDEIAGNGIDDDNNGYIDDVNGWNFLGNANGENVNDTQLEATRLYLRYDEKYKGKTKEDISKDELAEFEEYEICRQQVMVARKRATSTVERHTDMLSKVKIAYEKVEAKLGTDYTAKDIELAQEDTEIGEYATYIYPMVKKSGMRYEGFEAQISGSLNRSKQMLASYYNLELKERSIIGDDPSDFNDRNYGNNNVEGPDAFHGTHVAGIIAATRGNGIGSDGVADNVLIMSVRAVPKGDERDKDVALAIRYAVDNGAQIINGSFGKAYSPYKDEVIAAIHYAESKGVLICHAAGNSAKDIGVDYNFPSPKYPSMTAEFSNWIEVGASTRYKKFKASNKKGEGGNSGLAARFSNYNKEMVDVFAPGLEIYSTIPDNKYQAIQGTSMASPMVAGIAALLKSYFPKLTMFEIRDIIFASVQEVERETPRPGVKEQVPFSSLSNTGGIVNVYNAVVMAEAKSAGK